MNTAQESMARIGNAVATIAAVAAPAPMPGFLSRFVPAAERLDPVERQRLHLVRGISVAHRRQCLYSRWIAQFGHVHQLRRSRRLAQLQWTLRIGPAEQQPLGRGEHGDGRRVGPVCERLRQPDHFLGDRYPQGWRSAQLRLLLIEQTSRPRPASIDRAGERGLIAASLPNIFPAVPLGDTKAGSSYQLE